MIYHIFYEWLFKSLSAGGGGESYFVKALNVFQYVTFRTAYAAVTALLISLVFGGRGIGALRGLEGGEEIRGEGPAGAPAQARGADDGRRARHRLGAHLDPFVGAAHEPPHLDRSGRHRGLR